MALIELDLTAPAEPPPRAIPPAYRYRVPGLIVAVVLALGLGGAAPALPVLWRYLGAVPAPGGAEAPFQLTGGRLLTVTSSGINRVATAWSIEDRPRRLWTVSFPARVIGPDQAGFGAVDAELAGDVMVLSDGPATTVVDARTGATRWTTPDGMAVLAGLRFGVQQLTQFRDGTLYSQESGDAGELYFSATGEPHVEPPIRTEVRGVELSTGLSPWSVTEPGAVNVLSVPGDRPALLILSSSRLERRDGATGVLARQVTLPRLGGSGPTSGELTAGVLLAHYPGHEIAYDPGTLAKLWERDVPDLLLDPATCVEVLCAGGHTSLDVLDPATGRAAWRTGFDIDLVVRAGSVLEIGTRSGLPGRLADPATGRTLVDLAGWQLDVLNPDINGPLVVRRNQAGVSSAFGLADLEHHKVQPLGGFDDPVSSCIADGRYVVCRSNADLRVWAYRS